MPDAAVIAAAKSLKRLRVVTTTPASCSNGKRACKCALHSTSSSASSQRGLLSPPIWHVAATTALRFRHFDLAVQSFNRSRTLKSRCYILISLSSRRASQLVPARTLQHLTAMMSCAHMQASGLLPHRRFTGAIRQHVALLKRPGGACCAGPDCAALVFAGYCDAVRLPVADFKPHTLAQAHQCASSDALQPARSGVR